MDAAGCGAFHRNALIGGAAYGMPRNVHDSVPTAPWMSPLTVDTKHAGCALVARLTSGAARTDAAIATRTPADRMNGRSCSLPNGRGGRKSAMMARAGSGENG
jgi:hypothetical protein